MIFRNNFKLIYLVAVNKELKLWRNNEKDNHKGFLEMDYMFADNDISKYMHTISKTFKILNMRVSSFYV